MLLLHFKIIRFEYIMLMYTFREQLQATGGALFKLAFELISDKPLDLKLLIAITDV